MDEDSGVTAIELVEDWVEGWIPEVETVSVGEEAETVTAVFAGLVDFLEAGRHVWDGEGGEEAEAVGHLAFEICGVGITLAAQFCCQVVVPGDKMRARTGD